MAPPLIRIVPAALRLMVIELFAESPRIDSSPAAGAKLAVTAGMTRPSSVSKPARAPPCAGGATGGGRGLFDRD